MGRGMTFFPSSFSYTMVPAFGGPDRLRTQKSRAPMPAMDRRPVTMSMPTMVKAHSSRSSLMVIYWTVPACPVFHSGKKNFWT